jgi:transcriptional regulator GlxA family with amidase domain
MLADQAAMTPRTFTRKFTECMGDTPAKVIEKMRVEAASNALANTEAPLK